MDSSRKFVNPSPELKANYLSKLFFCWVLPFFKNAYGKDIDIKDIYNVNGIDAAGPLADRLERSWMDEVEKAKQNNGKPSLSRAIYRTFWKSYAIYGVFLFFQGIVIKNLQPVVIAEYISYHKEKKEYYELGAWHLPYESAGWILATSIVVLALFSVILGQYSMFACGRVGNRVRVACCSIVYRKVLRLSQASLGETAAGHVVNLLSNDAERIVLVAVFLHYLWLMPISFVVSFYIMIDKVGVAAIVTLISIALQTVPFQGYLSKLQGKYRMKIAKKTDYRVKLMSEIVSGIQVIKMYAWEKPFGKLVEISRRNEVNYITKSLYIKGVMSSLAVVTERFNLYLTIMVNLLMGIKPTSDVVYFMAQLINTIQMYMCIMFPMALAGYAEAKVTMRRLEEFLILEESIVPTNDDIEDEKKIIEDKTRLGLITIQNASASWSPEPLVNTLTDVNLKIPTGTLCCVVGNVGSGKSSLLQMMLKELPLKKGDMDLKGQISYASQEPWLFVSNVRNNILFGKPYVKERYNDVVEVCALVKDFEQFPYGDKTVVGERGVSLSGGQRARINLARAVYADADIYLFDDPLSAVDTHVGKHLFEKCIKGFLKDKTRILATHQLQFLEQADMIVVLNNGRVETTGTFHELSDNILKNLKENEEKNDDAVSVTSERSERKRLDSIVSMESSPQDEEEEEPKETQELMERGDLAGSLYVKYVRSGSNIFILICLVLLILISQIFNNACDLWVSYWTNLEQVNDMEYLNSTYASTPPPNYSEQMTRILKNSTNGSLYGMEDEPPVLWNCVIMYTFLMISSSALTIGRSFLFFKVCMRSSKEIHKKMFANVLRAPMRFFDTNPSGRILNRFSKDIGAVDEILPKSLYDVVIVVLLMVGILAMNCIVSLWTIIPAVLVGLISFYMRLIYLSSAQNVKRLEGITRAPVFSHVTATMYGLTTIRSSKAQDMVTKEFDILQDQHTSASFLFSVCSAAFGFYLDCVSTGFLALVTYQFLLGIGDFNSAEVGLVISSSLIIANTLQYAVRQGAEVSSNMTSVERLYQYIDLKTEDDLRKPPTKKPVKWPSNGKITFKDASLRYASDEGPVLRNLNFVIEAGEKVGIVGRTGAGKSSLLLSLFRLAPIEGTIAIDDIDTSDVSLEDLRSNISVIPQEPTLFSSTIRHNLDPFDKVGDEAIWQALDDVELKNDIGALDQKVNEGGSNFSAGQRQLICLARAILRNNKVLVMDEATANVDPQTDALVQRAIRKNFKDCTVLTIAHRLNTIMDCDKVIVMDFGEMVEYASPHELLQDRKSHFTKMVEQTGSHMAAHLREVAEEAYHEGKKNS